MPEWNDINTATLKIMWQEGHPAWDIAHVIGNCTKNAVLGKAFRMGYGPHPDAPQGGVAPELPHVAVKQADGPGCLWPFGHPRDADYHSCGGVISPDDWAGSYCAEHVARAYRVRTEDGKGWRVEV